MLSKKDSPLKYRFRFIICLIVVFSLTANEQGFAMLGDLKNVKPVTAAD